MINQDTCCTLAPYFKIHQGKLAEFKALAAKLVAAAEKEPGCMFYAITYNGDEAHCREGYKNGDEVLAHLGNVGSLLQQALQISNLTRLEAHGPAAELEKLRAPLKEMNPSFFALDSGFRR